MSTLLTPPVIDDATRREVAAVAAAGLLTGCATELPEPPTTAPVTVRHLGGTTEFATVPTRAVLLTGNRNLVDELLAAGVRGLAGFGYNPSQPMPSWQQQALTGVGWTNTGRPGADLNLELIASLQPEVIIGYADFPEEAVPEAASIAPVVLVPYFDTVERRRILGEVFDVADEFARVDAEERSTLATLEVPDGLTLSMIVSLDQDAPAVEVHNDTSPVGTLLTSLGFDLLEQEPVDDDWAYPSEENFGLLEADRIVNLTTYGPPSILDGSAVFQQLPAVAQGRFTHLDYEQSYSINFPSPLSTRVLVEALRSVIDLGR